MFCCEGRLKVNMGNIYFKQRNYSKAVKYYRMALDQVPNTHKAMRCISHTFHKNILICCVYIVGSLCHWWLWDLYVTVNLCYQGIPKFLNNLVIDFFHVEWNKKEEQKVTVKKVNWYYNAVNYIGRLIF